MNICSDIARGKGRERDRQGSERERGNERILEEENEILAEYERKNMSNDACPYLLGETLQCGILSVPFEKYLTHTHILNKP